ncbi:MAG: catalase [Firmicutes bacterium]|nr:catalase [Bacillota bacterium]
MTMDTGVKVSNDRRTLRAGNRGPLLFQDFHFYKKQSHFSRERIPEKVVHARGFGVHGVFECTKSMQHVTKAHFLAEVGRQTPVFVRFSNFIGSKGSKDTAQDVRGFATKFYTQEGNYDNLALSFGAFILADAMKFVDFTHAVKPNPVTDVPQATAAHDNIWDYITNNQESANFIMWLMSMRGRPRSWRMMEGYPINAFRFINQQGQSTFVRFIWKPKLGVHGLLLDEANIIGGVDPDYHRHDLIEAIERGAYPEYDFGVQMIPEADEFKYDFDVLDATKIWPEEIVPFEIIGKLTLDRLVENFFAEEEQSSFDPATLVPGIEFSNDPVLQGRAFAYRDTDYHRLGTGNILGIPINQPVVEVNYNQRDGYSRYRIDADPVHFHKNSALGGTPREASFEEGGYMHYPGTVEGRITRDEPSESFTDHFTQARMFWNSMSPIEQADLVRTFTFHIGKVKSQAIRQQCIDMFANVDTNFAQQIAANVGANPPAGTHVAVTKSSPILSMSKTAYSAQTQKVGVLIGNGFDDEEVKAVLTALEHSGAFYELISERLGKVMGANGTQFDVNETLITTYPVLYDSFYVVGGTANDQQSFDMCVKEFVETAYKFYKPIGIAAAATALTPVGGNLAGVIAAGQSSNFPADFVQAVTKQRFWERTFV